MIRDPHNTRVLQVETSTGFPAVQWTDDQHLRSFWTIFFNDLRPDGSSRYMSCAGEVGDGRQEKRGAIIEALDSLEWAEGRNCLASAPWVTPQREAPQEAEPVGVRL